MFKRGDHLFRKRCFCVVVFGLGQLLELFNGDDRVFKIAIYPNLCSCGDHLFRELCFCVGFCFGLVLELFSGYECSVFKINIDPNLC